MKKLYTTLCLVVCMVFSQNAFAQLQPLFDQYHFNQLVFNPAYAGSKGMLETNFFLHRHAVNIEGAPGSESFTAHTPLANDKIGGNLTNSVEPIRNIKTIKNIRFILKNKPTKTELIFILMVFHYNYLWIYLIINQNNRL